MRGVASGKVFQAVLPCFFDAIALVQTRVTDLLFDEKTILTVFDRFADLPGFDATTVDLLGDRRCGRKDDAEEHRGD